jgi:hypothetical protein
MWAIARERDPSLDTGYLHRARFVKKVTTVTGPLLRPLDQPSRDRIAMHILQLLHTLVMGEDVEVVVTPLPEGSGSKSPGDRNLQSQQRLENLQPETNPC